MKKTNLSHVEAIDWQSRNLIEMLQHMVPVRRKLFDDDGRLMERVFELDDTLKTQNWYYFQHTSQDKCCQENTNLV